MPKTTIARCSIYDRRPEVCKTYPTITHYTPPECTYYFAGSTRHGECACGEGACCAIPRENGIPGGTPLPEVAGGEPCKYLVYVEKDTGEEGTEKTASVDKESYNRLLKEVGVD